MVTAAHLTPARGQDRGRQSGLPPSCRPEGKPQGGHGPVTGHLRPKKEHLGQWWAVL